MSKDRDIRPSEGHANVFDNELDEYKMTSAEMRAMRESFAKNVMAHAVNVTQLKKDNPSFFREIEQLEREKKRRKFKLVKK